MRWWVSCVVVVACLVGQWEYMHARPCVSSFLLSTVPTNMPGSYVGFTLTSEPIQTNASMVQESLLRRMESVPDPAAVADLVGSLSCPETCPGRVHHVEIVLVACGMGRLTACPAFSAFVLRACYSQSVCACVGEGVVVGGVHSCCNFVIVKVANLLAGIGSPLTLLKEYQVLAPFVGPWTHGLVKQAPLFSICFAGCHLSVCRAVVLPVAAPSLGAYFSGHCSTSPPPASLCMSSAPDARSKCLLGVPPVCAPCPLGGTCTVTVAHPALSLYPIRQPT